MISLKGEIDQESEFYNDNFFVVDLNNLSTVRPKLYGYAITANEIYINSDNCNRVLPNDTCGAFVNITLTNNTLRIDQDYFGMYGLYLYKKDGYFAISNSFLYLVYYLKSIVRLSMNYEFMKSFIARPQASLSYEDTLVNEITMLPRNTYVTIDINSKEIKLSEILQRESYIDVNTKDGMQIIDSWHNKWNAVFETLANRQEQVTLKLSGGKDSRVSLACLFAPKISHLSNIRFFTAHDNLYTHGEDYEIAKKISSIYSFDIVSTDSVDRYRIDPLINLKSSLYAKAGFHRELCLTNFWKNRFCFTITGSGGDLRNLWTQTADEFIKENVEATVFHSIDSRKSLYYQMKKTVEAISRKYPDRNLTANDYFYKEGRQRNHNGKAMVESFLGNEIVISPLLDPTLYRLNQSIGEDNDNDLVYEIIFQRFLPEIKNIGFDSNRIIQTNTKLVAEKINKAFPLFATDLNREKNMLVICSSRIKPKDCGSSKDSALDVLNKIFKSDKLKRTICEELGEEAYIWAEEYYKNSYHPYIAAAALVEIYTVLEAVNESCFKSTFQKVSLPYMNATKKLTSKQYSNDGVMLHIFHFLSALRLECKNIGTKENNVILKNSSDKSSYFEVPKWLCDKDGNGFLVQGYKGKITLSITAINDGVLRFIFKGAWLKNSQGNAVPINIDIEKIIIKKENEVVFDCSDLVTVNSVSTKQVELKCKNGDCFEVELKWDPFYYNESDFLELLHTMRLVNLNYYRFWDKN